VDAYGTRLQVAFTAPLLALGIYLLMLVTPLTDPGRRNYPRFAGAYRLLRWGLVLFMAWIYGIWMAAALGHSVDILLAVKLSVSLLLLAIGNVMGQLRHNYFMGIRTPWTLASEEVWRRTHRLAGRLWVLGSLICLLLSFFPGFWSAAAFIAVIVLMTLIPVVYSFMYYRSLESSGEER